MNNKFRITVIGIGGVGGFIGAKLATRFQNSDRVEVILAARGNNLNAIRSNGLKLITAEGEMTIHPDKVTDDARAIGPVDLLICCTKAYHLEDSIRALANCIKPETIILPLLNGVDSTQKIRNILPGATVLEGCIYIVSKLASPGVVKQSGNFHALHFGGSALPAERASFLETLFSDAGIHAVKEQDIAKQMWSKFAFISPIATFTSAFNISIGKILESEEHSAALKGLMDEIILLATAMGISLGPDTIDANFEVMARLPYEATSSMQNDFANGKITELETLTGYVVREAGRHNLSLDQYEVLYQELREK